MTEIRFHDLASVPAERALPRLIETVLAEGARAVVMAGSAERVAALDAALWTYDPGSFLPHGSARDGNAERQPVYLTSSDENPNAASVLVVTDGVVADRVERFRLVLELFDGNVAPVVEAARARWKAYRAAGHDLAYLRLAASGAWERRG